MTTYSTSPPCAWRWGKKYKLMLQRVFLWFISSPSLSPRSERFLSSQLFFLWSKCPRQWAPGGEPRHFWLSLALPSSALFEEPVAQSSPIRWAWWPSCRRVSKGLVRGWWPWDTGGSCLASTWMRSRLPVSFLVHFFPFCSLNRSFSLQWIQCRKSMSRISLFKGSNNLSFFFLSFNFFFPQTAKGKHANRLRVKGERKKEKLLQSNFNLRSRAVETQKKCAFSNMVRSYKLINPERCVISVWGRELSSSQYPSPSVETFVKFPLPFPRDLRESPRWSGTSRCLTAGDTFGTGFCLWGGGLTAAFPWCLPLYMA